MHARELPNEVAGVIQLLLAAQGILKISYMLLEALKEKYVYYVLKT